MFQGPVLRLWNLALAAKIRLQHPDLVVISQGQAYDGCFPISLPEACRFAGVPYALICQKAAEIHWPDDSLRALYRSAYAGAAASYFVSEHNRHTVEMQMAMKLPRAAVVRNPFMVRAPQALPWPELSGDVLRLACVARMWPLEKSQDVLLHVLAQNKWRERPVELSFYGEGPMSEGLQDMAKWLGLTNVRFPGFTDPREIWRSNHALVLPSRAEGLPLAQVEAMMCGRPVIVSDAGGAAEIMRDGQDGFLAIAATVTAIDDALERAWQRRADWSAMGLAAAQHIRTLFPADPCETFADLLQELHAHCRGELQLQVGER